MNIIHITRKEATKMVKKQSSVITNQILDYLNKGGHYVCRINNIPGSKYKSNTLTKGVADIMGCTKKGIALAVEVKTTDKQSEHQKKFEYQFRKRGGIYILAHSLDDVIEAGL